MFVTTTPVITAAERHHRPDREVDAARDDDERHAERQDADHRRRHQDPDDVVDWRKFADATEKKTMMHDQRAERQQALDRPPPRTDRPGGLVASVVGIHRRRRRRGRVIGAILSAAAGALGGIAS